MIEMPEVSRNEVGKRHNSGTALKIREGWNTSRYASIACSCTAMDSTKMAAASVLLENVRRG